MTVHSPHLEILEDGLNSECVRCVDLANHPDQLDAVNVARLRAGRLLSGLDLVAAQNLAAWDREWSA